MAPRRSILKINGRLHYLWRAVDKDADVLDILVQSGRDKKADKKFFRKLLKGLRYASRVIIITSHFRPGRHLCAAGDYREMMRRRFDAWDVVVDAPAAA